MINDDIEALRRRFERHYKVDPETGCWMWTARCDHKGYGAFRCNSPRTIRRAHRVAWLLHRGPVPDETFVLHRCDVRACVNPQHLFLGTAKDNTEDMLRKGRGLSPGAPGEANRSAKLNEGIVRSIRADTRSGVALAEAYGVTPTMISYIRNRKAWRHVP